ncbi:F-box domain-containing protein [Mycena chlorophos]|uniref:F-box domain-containing protein n=1 Tax=Mycena chlorophos TaxID=658473 RepID=A0A8H6TGY7_MYCCL|nr:F-box domain-containing protein [Mycena chlorophos]
MATLARRYPKLPSSALHTISALDTTIAHLLVRRDEILAQHGSLPQRMTTLHPELLSEIFQHFVDYACLGSFSGPLILTSVCRHWREIALATPRLWRTVKINSLARWNAFPRLVELFLQRAGSVPIDVYRLPPSHIRHFVPHHAHRLGHLELSHGVPALFHGLNAIDSFPVLESVRIVMLLREVAQPIPVITFLRQAPRLTEVAVDLWSLHSSDYDLAQILALPAHQLRSLHVYSLFREGCFTTLSQARSLVYLTLDIAYEDTDVNDAYIVFPNLRILHVHPPAVLRILETPSLESLDLMQTTRAGLGGGSYTQSEVPIVTDFVSRSGCSITELHFVPNAITACHILMELAFLKKLHIECSTWRAADTHRFFSSLALPSGDIVPHLESLSMVISAAEPVSVVNLARMIRARRRQVGRLGQLSKCEVRSPSTAPFFDDNQSLGWLKEMREEGLEFSCDVPLYGKNLDRYMVEKMIN